MRARKFGFFWLPFDEGELRDLLDSAHKHGLVQPLWPPLSEAERCDDSLAWLPTDRGRKVQPPRSLSPVDLGYEATRAIGPFKNALATIVSIAVFVLAPIASKDELLGDEGPFGNKTMVVGLVIGLLALGVIVNGTRGEYRLRKVARTWTRFRRNDEEALKRIRDWYLRYPAWPWLGPAIAFLSAGTLWAVLEGLPALWVTTLTLLTIVLSWSAPRWWRFTRQIRQRGESRSGAQSRASALHEVRTEPGRVTGVVKWWSDEKGFGFLTTDAGEDVFVHHTHLLGKGFPTLSDGARVEFGMEKGDKGPTAVDVRTI